MDNKNLINELLIKSEQICKESREIDSFIRSKEFENLDEQHQRIVKYQKKLMLKHCLVLLLRIDIIKSEINEKTK
jgi:hypothetical protein